LKLTFKVLPERYAIAQLAADADVPQWALSGAIFSVTRTPTELSVICEERVCAADKAERGWRCIEVVGPFPRTAVGVAAEFSRVLAERKISLLVGSTYDTDYIFLSEQTLDRAVEALIDAGHDVIR
jgi:uncharacterized protein